VRGLSTAGIALAAAVVLLVWMLSAPVGREYPEARQANAGHAEDAAAAKGPLGEAFSGNEVVGVEYRLKNELRPLMHGDPLGIDTDFGLSVKLADHVFGSNLFCSSDSVRSITCQIQSPSSDHELAGTD